MTVDFYRLRGCPYCRRVEKVLDQLDVDYDTHDVPARKSQRSTVKALTGQAGVPVIVDRSNGVEGMAESTDIIRYLEATYG